MGQGNHLCENVGEYPLTEDAFKIEDVSTRKLTVYPNSEIVYVLTFYIYMSICTLILFKDSIYFLTIFIEHVP